MEKSTFTQFELKAFLLEAIEHIGFQKPTEIQARIIPIIKKGESVIGQSQTGTGKTHAYLLPVLDRINPQKEQVQAVITAPTRELASQIFEELNKLISFCPEQEQITAKLFIGGTDKLRAIEKLKSQPHVVVGTPGRINDLIKEQALFVHTGTMLVVDEADLMLDMGFIFDVDQIAARMAQELQMLVFSATIPEKLKPFLKKYLENPTFTAVAPRQVAAEKIEHLLIPLRHRDKIELVYEISKQFNPYLALIFTNTKVIADEVADRLLEKGLKVGRIHGDLTPRERKKMMKQIKDLEYQFIVATDLASRGIDIEGVSHVINYELPSDLAFYIHRVGRTARAGFSGTAATIYEARDRHALDKLEKMGIDFKHVDIRNGEWIDLGVRDKRKERKKQLDEPEIIAHKVIKKPKTVKPGYKKKRQQLIEQFVRREKRKMKKRSK
ncbi:DEAD/DEAH box helicase [Calidifontibacillus erzurumensis]|uniref:DEAD-box ATP-dependent RNA helicase CshB n=1 Tax=Calidifontibacillus erzurumensis TaxID=2741433 RepID=A0A8J8GBC0_9BACI|nr:DEAD/DEAH box helicase [Calidifontibacillus erzurumensis]NSL50307.1 DEAD/DEAH box helicase [Calidifontibacillus erzurumensis]